MKFRYFLSGYQYPGILPDNPLYQLKVLRDGIIGFFISDPLKKSEFDLLQADKRLNVGIFFFNKEKKELSEKTISKGENYFEKALEDAKLARNQGREINPMLLTNLELASKKHEEVIKDLMSKSSGDVAKGFGKTLQRVDKFENQAVELKSK